MRTATQAGFTLIELMITVTVIAILASIAIPMYGDYTRRGKITEATSALSDFRIRAERWYADNRTYQTVPASGSNAGFSFAVQGARYFTYNCVAPTANTYTCTATGSTGMTGFTYTVDQSNQRSSTITGVSGWTGNSSCWVTRKGGQC